MVNGITCDDICKLQERSTTQSGNEASQLLVLALLASLASETQPTLPQIGFSIWFTLARLPCLYASVKCSATFHVWATDCSARLNSFHAIWALWNQLPSCLDSFRSNHLAWFLNETTTRHTKSTNRLWAYPGWTVYKMVRFAIM